MLFALAFISGTFTVLSPCIWHVLPLLLTSNIGGSKKYALGLALGVSMTFGAFILLFNYIIKLFPFDPVAFKNFSVIFILTFGIILLVRPLSEFIETLLSKVTSRFNINISKTPGFRRGFIAGAGMSFLWSPCAGPILVAISSVGATQNLSASILLFTLCYVLGVAIPLFIITVVGTKLTGTVKNITKYTKNTNQITGIIFILTAIAIYTGFGQRLENYLVEKIPNYYNIILFVENNDRTVGEIQKLKSN